ncbi:hypothetical protein AG1IA_01954 [Rhizoctonia solani AG-1 IA]|uniref:Uncharacterized protein n=1 Tax=Thanatephorus cucumeris (strain AG1-IA) TaxID=983506 RepID=L8X0Z9_THACA|nr:hypothetical protein AG1IA_01954 [Rhizoctonia solani AG-1 IA]
MRVQFQKGGYMTEQETSGTDYIVINESINGGTRLSWGQITRGRGGGLLSLRQIQKAGCSVHSKSGSPVPPLSPSLLLFHAHGTARISLDRSRSHKRLKRRKRAVTPHQRQWPRLHVPRDRLGIVFVKHPLLWCLHKVRFGRAPVQCISKFGAQADAVLEDIRLILPNNRIILPPLKPGLPLTQKLPNRLFTTQNLVDRAAQMKREPVELEPERARGHDARATLGDRAHAGQVERDVARDDLVLRLGREHAFVVRDVLRGAHLGYVLHQSVAARPCNLERPDAEMRDGALARAWGEVHVDWWGGHHARHVLLDQPRDQAERFEVDPPCVVHGDKELFEALVFARVVERVVGGLVPRVAV